LLFKKPLTTTSFTIQIIERRENYSFFGNLEIVFCKNPGFLKYYMKKIDSSQVVRIGRAENYDNCGFSFLFIQHAVNRNEFYGIGCSNLEEEYFMACNVDLNRSEEIGDIVRMIMDLAKIQSKEIEKLKEWSIY